MKENICPRQLYKILSIEDWHASQPLKFVKLPAVDQDFIHFSTKEQLSRIIKKYWSHVQQFIVLKVDPLKLPGTLVFETNPGGINQYYHLYNGCIPFEAIIESQTITQN